MAIKTFGKMIIFEPYCHQNNKKKDHFGPYGHSIKKENDHALTK
jgi:hypothetical protein